MLTKLLEMVKSRIKIIVIIATIILLALIIFKKGIVINNTNNQYQYQNQSQSQLVVSMMMQQGGFEWKYIDIKNETELLNKINNLEPYQSLFCKVIRRGFSSSYQLMYPAIKTKK